MGKWTRRGFITAGVIGGSALLIGVAIRPGHRTPALARLVAGENESLVNAWVKIDADNHVTAIIPHSEMGQGAQTALAQMLADELDADWADVSFMEAPAADDYANYALGKGFILGTTQIPKILAGTVDGVFLQASKAMHLQITGGSLSVRATGVYGMRVAGAAARLLLLEAAADTWGVDQATLSASNGMISPCQRQAGALRHLCRPGWQQDPLRHADVKNTRAVHHHGPGQTTPGYSSEGRWQRHVWY